VNERLDGNPAIGAAAIDAKLQISCLGIEAVDGQSTIIHAQHGAKLREHSIDAGFRLFDIHTAA
jgi:hypothetical protein